MRIQYFSKISGVATATSIRPTAPILILLGDIISPFHPSANRIINYFSANWDKILWVPGKKELVHDNASYEESIETMQNLVPKNVTILNKNYYESNKIIIVGTTLLSQEFKNMNIYPYGHNIMKKPIQWELNALINQDYNWLRGILEECREHNHFNKIIVATYTAPLPFSNEYGYVFNNYPILYLSKKYSPDYWFIGNTEKNTLIYMFDEINKPIGFGSNSGKYTRNFGINQYDTIQ